MDVTDISKVASRKRMNTDAEKLREKVSRETAKIIKLKVAQDTAYWDLKERLQQLQGAHERLQQNMVDVQMQHEAASAQYARELRLRPDTLNKLAGARAVGDVLEQFGERLRRGVARSRADRAALQAAYAQCGARVRRLAARLAAARAAAAAHRAAARKGTANQVAEARRLNNACELLGAARARADELAAARDLLAARLRQADEAAAAMRDDVARLAQQSDAQLADMKQSVARLEEQARAARADAAARAADLRRAEERLADAKNAIEQLKTEGAIQIDKVKSLEQVINNKTQHEQDLEAEIRSLKKHAGEMEEEKIAVSNRLSASELECSTRGAALADLSAAAERLRADLERARADLAAQADAAAAAASAAAAARERDAAAHAASRARLAAELRDTADARDQAAAALDAARLQADAERDAARRALQAKDDELAAQMTIILDMRAEKERLQERIQGMQSTIDNIQKELTGRLAAPKGASGQNEPPEQDAPRRADDATVYSFLSDGSVDGDALDAREVGRRFEALAQCAVRGGPQRRQGSISLSQMKDDLKIKSRTFFKNKRFDSKSKKIKYAD